MFSYEKLDNPSNSIRLFNILPGDFNDPIAGLLNHHYLQIENNTTATSEAIEVDEITYEALSYAWGDPTPNKVIFVNDRALKVATNLKTALRHLRYPDSSRTLWADALCINQSDDIEKSGQVQIMHNIYSLADGIVAWLGTGTPDTDSHFEAMEKAAADGSSLLAEDFVSGGNFPISDWPQYEIVVKAVSALGEWNYWRRGWGIAGDCLCS